MSKSTKQVITVDNTDEICLYCGQEIKRQWDEYDSYYECNCSDAVLARQLDFEIDQLKQKYPKHKFAITKVLVLREENI